MKKVPKTIVSNITLDFDIFTANYSGKAFSWSLIQLYQGHALIDRLVFCAQACPDVRIEAYKLAIQEVQEKTGNVELYQSLVTMLNTELEGAKLEALDLDLNWISLISTSGSERSEK